MSVETNRQREDFHVEINDDGYHRRGCVRRGLVVAAYTRRRGGGAIWTFIYQFGRYRYRSGELDKYIAAIKENGAASVKDPGCREFNVTVSQKDPNHVLLFEVYDNAAAAEAHRATDHFKKYVATTANMIAKRDVRAFSSVAMYTKGM